MALNTSNNNLNKNNSSFWNKMVNKVQEVKNTVNQVNAENAKANAAVKAVQDERVLKKFGIENKNVMKNDVKSTTIGRDKNNRTFHFGNKKGLFESNFDIDLQSDKFIYANDEINNSKNSIDQVKKRLGDIMTYSKEIDDDMLELTNDLNVVKNIGDNVEGISGDLSSVKEKLNIIDPDFGNNSFLFDMAWMFGSDSVKSKKKNGDKNGNLLNDGNVENQNLEINPIFGVLYDELYKNLDKSIFKENTETSASVNKFVTDEPVLGMLYDQTEYDGIKYGIGDLSSNGCGFFSSLSIVTAKTGYEFSYDEIVELAEVVNSNGNSSLSNEQRMEVLLDLLSDRKHISNWYKGPVSDVVSSLEDGKGVIALTNSSRHFVPISGLTDNGNLVVNDTDGNAYRSSLWRRQRIDELGFDMSKGEFLINARCADTDGDGINDDVWYINFDKYMDGPIVESNDAPPVNDVSLSNDTTKEVPRIFQTDYSDVRYGGYNEKTGQPKTVATSGCGITCMAMVDTYYNGEFVSPADVISTSGYHGCSVGTGYEFFPRYSEQKNLPYVETIDYSTAESFDKVKGYLAEGGLVVANMRSNSIFTKDAHYILLTGINEDGKIMVNDPNKDNYKEFNDNPGKSLVVGKILTDGFENGFDESEFWYGKARKFWVFLENDSSS